MFKFFGAFGTHCKLPKIIDLFNLAKSIELLVNGNELDKVIIPNDILNNTKLTSSKKWDIFGTCIKNKINTATLPLRNHVFCQAIFIKILSLLHY